MILLYVEDNGNGRIKRQKRVIILARLHNDGIARSDSVPCLEQRQRSADHDCGVFFGRHKDMSAHGGGRSLAVGSGNAQGVFIALHDSAPCLGALKHGNAHLMRANDLGVFVMRCGRAHDKINVACYIRRVMAYGYDYSLFAQMRGSLALCDIRAAYYKSCVGKHLGQRRHGNAAYANEMTSFSSH